MTGPAMEITAHTAQSLVAHAESQTGCGEGLTGFQDVFGGLRRDAGIEMVHFVERGVEAKFEVAAPAEGRANHLARILLRFSVQ